MSRIVIPVQVVGMLVLGLASLMDSEGDEGVVCVFQNTLKRSFEPMLWWRNGPPPT